MNRRESNNRDNVALLMSIVRAIVSTTDPDDRIQVCSQVSRNYQESGDSLGEVVALKSAELLQVMRLCSVLQAHLAKTRLKLVELRTRLQQTRQLLSVNSKNCYTELWPELIESRAILDLLERAERTYKTEVDDDDDG